MIMTWIEVLFLLGYDRINFILPLAKLLLRLASRIETMENYHISQNLTLSVMHVLERYFYVLIKMHACQYAMPLKK